MRIPKGTQTLVDKLGQVKAQIADLEKQEATLRQQLIDLGIDEADGKLFHCTVSRYTLELVDYKAICEVRPPSRYLRRKYTSEQERVTVKVTSR